MRIPATTTLTSALLLAVNLALPATGLAKAPPMCTETLLGWTADRKAYVVHSMGCKASHLNAIRIHDMFTRKTSVICTGNRTNPASLAKCPRTPWNAKKTPAVRRLGVTTTGTRTGKKSAAGKAIIRKLGDRFYFELKKKRTSKNLGKSPKIAFHSQKTAWRIGLVRWSPGKRSVVFQMHFTGADGTLHQRQYGFLFNAVGMVTMGPTFGRRTIRIGARRIGVTVRATSTRPAQGSMNHSPANLLDPKNAWCEYAPGTGKGEKITYTFAARVRIRGFEFKPGYHFRPHLWKTNNRVKRLIIRTSKKTTFTAIFPNRKSTVKVPMLKGPQWVKWVTFTIKSVFKGASPKANDTCMTMIKPY